MVENAELAVQETGLQLDGFEDYEPDPVLQPESTRTEFEERVREFLNTISK